MPHRRVLYVARYSLRARARMRPRASITAATCYISHYRHIAKRNVFHGRLCVRLCVCLSLVAFIHYCADLDVTLKNGRGYTLVVQYWVDLQSVHGIRCYGNIHAEYEMSARTLALAVWMAGYSYSLVGYLLVDLYSASVTVC